MICYGALINQNTFMDEHCKWRNYALRGCGHYLACKIKCVHQLVMG